MEGENVDQQPLDLDEGPPRRRTHSNASAPELDSSFLASSSMALSVETGRLSERALLFDCRRKVDLALAASDVCEGSPIEVP